MPIFLETCSVFAGDHAGEMEKKYELIGDEIKDLQEMKEYLRESVYVFWMDTNGNIMWRYEEKNKIITRQDLRNNHSELIMPEEIEKHWKEANEKGGKFIIKRYEKKIDKEGY